MMACQARPGQGQCLLQILQNMTYNAIFAEGGFFIPENVVAIIIFDYENDPVIKEDPPGTK